jgi:hypothetical protein
MACGTDHGMHALGDGAPDYAGSPASTSSAHSWARRVSWTHCSYAWLGHPRSPTSSRYSSGLSRPNKMSAA